MARPTGLRVARADMERPASEQRVPHGREDQVHPAAGRLHSAEGPGAHPAEVRPVSMMPPVRSLTSAIDNERTSPIDIMAMNDDQLMHFLLDDGHFSTDLNLHTN